MSIDSYVCKIRHGAPGAPIFFAFHGTGGDERQFFDFVSRLMPGATIVSPRGSSNACDISPSRVGSVKVPPISVNKLAPYLSGMWCARLMITDCLWACSMIS